MENISTSKTVRRVSDVERLRREFGWRQSDLANASNLSTGTITAVEAGYIPGQSARRAIAVALGVEQASLWPDVAV